MAQWFGPLKGKTLSRQVMAFDLEGIGGPDGFLCGVVVGDFICNFFTDREEMLNVIVGYAQEGYWIFSHNLQYDLPVLEGAGFPGGNLLFSRSSLLWADYKANGRKGRLYDSKNLFPRHSVRALGLVVGLPKLDIQPELMGRIVAGTPWGHLGETDQRVIEKYCLRDAEIVFLAVSMLQEILLSLGGNLRPTIAGCSMDLYRRRFHNLPWRVVPDNVNKAARSGYYGGRTENFAYGRVPDCSMYDVTSLYPHAMGEVRFPHPNYLSLEMGPKVTGDWLRWEGVAHVEIDVPHFFVPLLPHRYSNRVFFPYGTMTGSWPIIEIRRALDYGAKLERVDWALGSDTTFNPFREFIETLFSLRLHYLTNNQNQANIIKLLLNSLYGRWGIDPEGGLYRLVELTEDSDLDAFQGYSTHVMNGRLLAHGPIEMTRTPDYQNVFFAAQVTAGGRLFMLDALCSQGEQLIYCDTDSIITQGEIETGPGLGEWRLQMKKGEADLIGPKEYALHNRVSLSRYHAKGVPPRVAEDYIKKGFARFQRAVSIREALRDRLMPSQWVETFKTHQEICPKRYPAGHPEGQPGDWEVTYPYRISDLPEAVLGSFGPPDLAPDVRDRILPAPMKLVPLRLSL